MELALLDQQRPLYVPTHAPDFLVTIANAPLLVNIADAELPSPLLKEFPCVLLMLKSDLGMRVGGWKVGWKEGEEEGGGGGQKSNIFLELRWDPECDGKATINIATVGAMPPAW